MKLNLKAVALTSAILWGGGVLLTSLANIAWLGYGQAFLDVLASVYPGYYATASLSQAFIATFWSVVDGLLGGLVFGWLYNCLAG